MLDRDEPAPMTAAGRAYVALEMLLDESNGLDPTPNQLRGLAEVDALLLLMRGDMGGPGHG